MTGETGLRFVKGHGTENDFVVVPDPDGDLELSPALVRALCDRRAGVGADGVLRVVLTAAVPDVAQQANQARWFMDYRNADGSAAEMCGNGVRVYARYLLEAGYSPPGTLRLATRSGVKTVDAAPTGDVTVHMGRADVAAERVTVTVGGRTYEGTPVALGNPHVVVRVADLAEVGDLSVAPVVRPMSPTGTNVEFVVLPAGAGAPLDMRVHERGVGETRSCGTGACAMASAVAEWAGVGDGFVHDVRVPGGLLRVERTAEGELLLTGPAVLVTSGWVTPEWLAAVPDETVGVAGN